MKDRDHFKFTEHARKVLIFAQEEAQHFQHNYIDTEHVLLGLTREPQGVIPDILSNLSVDQATVRSKTLEAIKG